MPSNPVILSRQAFRQYLESCATTIAGRKCLTSDCPIARHLLSEFRNDIAMIDVIDDRIMYEDFDIYSGTLSIPKWAQSFISQFDESKHPPTGLNCLTILDSIDPTDNATGEQIDPTE